MRNEIISLYDYTGEALRPWAEAGYECYAYDIQHPLLPTTEVIGAGFIVYAYADLFDPDDTEDLLYILAKHGGRAAFMSAFPPCTDLASSGARWWKSKEAADPQFQDDAVHHVQQCARAGQALGCPYYIENPVGALTRLWRKPDYTFDPCDYGGYLPVDDIHPKWPEIIPPRDGYRKKTCLWTGGDFRMPTKRVVSHLTLAYDRADPSKGANFSPVAGKTGGKSLRTKNIRSATPRGFARAVFEANTNYEQG
jgi:hypothetical protein